MKRGRIVDLWSGAMNNKEMKRELEAVKKELSEVQHMKYIQEPQQSTNTEFVKYLVDQRVGEILGRLAEKIRTLEQALVAMEKSTPTAEEIAIANSSEVAVSNIDAKILEFVQIQPKSMACASDVRKFMNYRGNNAACARLNRLYQMNLLDRFQLGHRVYYKFDAGKATNTLILSPPQ